MSTYYAPTDRREWATDKDGVPFISKHDGQARTFVFDLTDMAEIRAGATVSSVAWTDSGVSVSGSTHTSGQPSFSVTVTGTDGYATVTATLSTGKTIIQTFRFVGVPDGRGGDDYGN